MRKLFCLVLLLLVLKPAQAGWVIGYNGGVYPHMTRNFQAHAQSFNLGNSDLITPWKFNPFFRGITTGFRVNVMDDFGFFAFTFTTRKVESNWGKTPNIEQKMRLRTNYISAEMGMGSENFKGGASVDIGGTKVRIKRHDPKTGETTEWENFYDGGALYDGGFLSAGFSLFVEARPAENLYIRLFSMLPIGMARISDDNTDRSFGFNYIHHGLSVYLDLFRRD